MLRISSNHPIPCPLYNQIAWPNCYTLVMAKGKSSKKSPDTPKEPQNEILALPIQYWSYSSLMSFLRNPLAWYKRYVQRIYDTPRTPAAVVGSAAHLALQHF